MDTETVPYQPGVQLAWGSAVSVGFPKLIFFLLPLLENAQNMVKYDTLLHGRTGPNTDGKRSNEMAGLNYANLRVTPYSIV